MRQIKLLTKHNEEANYIRKEYNTVKPPTVQDVEIINQIINDDIFIEGVSIRGWRSTHEDSHIIEVDGDNMLFVVFDGHGGDWVANYCASHYADILFNTEEYKREDYKEAFIVTNRLMDEKIYNESKEEMLNYAKTKITKKLLLFRHRGSVINRTKFHHSDECGCTCCAVLVTPNEIITSNIGDSKAMIMGVNSISSLNREHKVSELDERERISKTKYTIINDRIEGILNVSRAFGDFKYKDMENGNQDEYGIISIPEIGIMKRNQKYNIIIGCDGLWDCYNELDVRNYIISFYSCHELPSYYMFENEKRNRMYKLITNVDQSCAFNLGMSCIADNSFINETCGYDNVTILMASC